MPIRPEHMPSLRVRLAWRVVPWRRLADVCWLLDQLGTRAAWWAHDLDRIADCAAAWRKYRREAR